MLNYLASLHTRSLRPTNGFFPYDWEEIGPGYAKAFGHWDIVHEVLDHLPVNRTHACKQLINNLYHQTPDGLVPGSIWMFKEPPSFANHYGHPPLWILAVEDYAALYESLELVLALLPNLLRQIDWFEKNRKAEPKGFFYLDILTHDWESGVDEGVRFDQVQTGKKACIDATSHVYLMYDCASRWMEKAGQDSSEFRSKANELQEFITTDLYSTETGFFYDIWATNDPTLRVTTFEGFWPLVCGAAATAQAQTLINDYLLCENEFFTAHPVPSVAASESAYEQRMWRGPAWNSMTYWIARGCVKYGRQDAARAILERALDATAEQFELTGTIWEFYHSQRGSQQSVRRKAESKPNLPCRDYLGHNPLFAMSRLYDQCVSPTK